MLGNLQQWEGNPQWKSACDTHNILAVVVGRKQSSGASATKNAEVAHTNSQACYSLFFHPVVKAGIEHVPISSQMDVCIFQHELLLMLISVISQPAMIDWRNPEFQSISWLVGGFNSSEKYLSVGITIPNIRENKKCSKPPISYKKPSKEGLRASRHAYSEKNPTPQPTGPPTPYLFHYHAILGTLRSI